MRRLSNPGDGRAQTLTSSAVRRLVWLPSVRRVMERLFRTSLAGVRLSVGGQARSLGARACTVGEAVDFAPGEFAPCSADGWHVLAHELAHVLQQRKGVKRRASCTRARVLVDARLEAEAELYGELAALWFHGVRLAAPRRPVAAQARRGQAASVVQCLMPLEQFKASSSAPGARDKIKVVDSDLGAFHLLDKQAPRDYRALLTQLRKLHQACQTYLRARPDSKRKTGVEQLVREIALEEVVVSSLADYGAAATGDAKWKALEQTQERFQQIKVRPDWKRAGFHQELEALIQEFQRTHDVGAAAIRADIDELKRLGSSDSVPAVLRSIIQEVTAASNLQQIGMGSIFSASAKYNTTRGMTPKYTLNHNLNQHLGKKLRIGSLLHELTHVSIAETFGNTVLMFAIDVASTDDQILELARIRRGRILSLTGLIDTTNDLPGELKSELKSKVGYPVSGKLGTYLANFKKQLDPAIYARFSALLHRGLDCELIEYDTVINQMFMWCHLWGVSAHNPVYTRLETLANLDFQYRAAARPRRRLVRAGPVRAAVPPPVAGRRNSIV